MEKRTVPDLHCHYRTCAAYNFISFLRNGVWNQDTIFMGIFFVVPIFTVCIVIRREISPDKKGKIFF